MLIGLLIVSGIVVLLIGFGGGFSREHYIYSQNEQKTKKVKKPLFYMYEDNTETTDINENFAPYHCSLKNTIDTLYDC